MSRTTTGSVVSNIVRTGSLIPTVSQSVRLTYSTRWHHHSPRHYGQNLGIIFILPSWHHSHSNFPSWGPRHRGVETSHSYWNSSPTKSMNIIQWTLFHITLLWNGGWAEDIPFIYSSFKSILYFISISFSMFYFYSIPIPSFITLYSVFCSILHSFIWWYFKIYSAYFTVHLFQSIAYSIPFYSHSYFNFHFLLVSLIFNFTLYSISFVSTYDIMF